MVIRSHFSWVIFRHPCTPCSEARIVQVSDSHHCTDTRMKAEMNDPCRCDGHTRSWRFAGSYYLTTTYGALEHIKNYDKITVTRQLSTEVQDSIHRWERRRTLNKARASRSSVQVAGITFQGRGLEDEHGL